MKKIIFSVIFCLAMCGSAFAQSKFPELDKIKQIKLLESTRDDVVRIFGYLNEEPEDENSSVEEPKAENSSEEIETTDEEEPEEEEIDRDEFSTDDLTIRFRYSLGNCSDDDDQEWNVAKGKVTEINIIFDEAIEPEDLKIALSKLEKIREVEPDEEDAEEEEDPDDFIYYDKQKGVSYGLSDGKIKNIKFTPTENHLSALCNNETVREDYPSNKEWLIDKIRNRPSHDMCRCVFANVNELILDKNEITSDYPAKQASTTDRNYNYFKIAVETKAESNDPNDVLTYNYTISGGKIIGEGANIVWDLIGVKPGTYTITAGVDNGCGVCGTTRTETVTVKDCPDCSQKPK